MPESSQRGSTAARKTDARKAAATKKSGAKRTAAKGTSAAKKTAVKAAAAEEKGASAEEAVWAAVEEEMDAVWAAVGLGDDAGDESRAADRAEIVYNEDAYRELEASRVIYEELVYDEIDPEAYRDRWSGDEAEAGEDDGGQEETAVLPQDETPAAAEAEKPVQEPAGVRGSPVARAFREKDDGSERESRGAREAILTAEDPELPVRAENEETPRESEEVREEDAALGEEEAPDRAEAPDPDEEARVSSLDEDDGYEEYDAGEYDGYDEYDAYDGADGYGQSDEYDAYDAYDDFDAELTRRRRRPFIIACCVLLALLIGMAAFLLLRGGGADTPGEAEGEALLSIDRGAQAWSGGQSAETGGNAAGASGIRIPGYPSITVPSGEQDVYVALLNPEGNPCYLSFQLLLKDGYEKLYESSLVPPGSVITEITLARPLEAGEYDAVVRVTASELESGNVMNHTDVDTVIIAQ